MAIKWVCTGKSEHGYQYKDAEGVLQNGSVFAIDFKAEIDTESEAGAVNELFDTKPVLTEAGVGAFVGLQVYPQGFTVYLDNRITNMVASGVIDIAGTLMSVLTFKNINVGFNLPMESGGTPVG